MSQILREYIGATNRDIVLKSVPNDKYVPFHFLLAFAMDYDESGVHQNGDFHERWIAGFSPKMISDYKTSYNDAKVLLSIGWYDASFPFKVSDKGAWKEKAAKSIEAIINKFNLDGLDVHYCNIDPGYSSIFAECIGYVIKKLKDDKVAKIVSISPLPMLDSYYSELYLLSKDNIDLLNYQFYSGTYKIDNVEKFKEEIVRVQSKYPNAKVIVGYSTDTGDESRNIPKDVLFNAYDQMSNKLSGIFVWSADKSSPGFQFEIDAQKELKGK